jgi:superfamily II DNA or RNA helicase
LSDDGELPAGLFWATRKGIERECGIEFELSGRLQWPEMKSTGNLSSADDWQFQNRCVEKMVRTSRFGGGLVVNATGTGKTRLSAMLFSRISGKGCFIVDQLVLMEQAIADLEKELGEKVGMVGNSIFEPRRITVGTVQTMHKHQDYTDFQKWTRQLDVMFIDEIHEQMNHRNFSVVQNIRPKAVYGLTATLQLRKKNVRLRAWSLAGPVIYEFPLVEGQRRGVLTKGVAIRVMVDNRIDMEDISSDMATHKHGTWGRFYDEKIVHDVARNEVVEDIIRKARKEGRFSAALVTRVEHLRELADRLPDVPHRVIAGTFRGQHVDIKDRMLFKDSFEEGKVRVIIANTVMKKGVNIKRLDVVVDAAAGSNPNDPIQKFGRGVRLHEDKDGLLYFDISDYDPDNRYNWFQKAAKRRARALKQAGIPVHVFWWGKDGKEDELWKFAEEKLRTLDVQASFKEM